MARQRDPDPDSCCHSPFKSLKGLSCPDRNRQGGPPAPAPQAVAVDDGDAFASAMESLAVRPLPGNTGAPDRKPQAAPAATDRAGDAEVVEFLQAVGRLDRSFRDNLPSAEVAPRARPRRLKQLERGELNPSGELDLHGLHRDAALARTRTFLAQAVSRQWPVVLIVTGKGLHSGEGPVLRRAVERLLDDSRSLVLEWGEAPRRYGGSGALVIFLRPPGKP